MKILPCEIIGFPKDEWNQNPGFTKKTPPLPPKFVIPHSNHPSFTPRIPLIIDHIAFFSLQPMQDFNKAVFSFVLGENT
jgi:hypothetical protein